MQGKGTRHDHADGGAGGGAGGGTARDRLRLPERDVHRRAELVEVLGGDCTEGRSWGWDRGGIWVDNGCRARFRVN